LKPAASARAASASTPGQQVPRLAPRAQEETSKRSSVICEVPGIDYQEQNFSNVGRPIRIGS